MSNIHERLSRLEAAAANVPDGDAWEFVAHDLYIPPSEDDGPHAEPPAGRWVRKGTPRLIIPDFDDRYFRADGAPLDADTEESTES